MIKKVVSSYEARTNLGEIMNLVYYKGYEFLVKKKGKPMVKITKVSSPEKTRTKILAKYAGVWKDDKNIRKIETAMKEFRKNLKLTRF